MKTISLTVDEKTWRSARKLAAARDTSVDALVREALAGMVGNQPVLATAGAAEKEQRLRLVNLLEQCQIDLTERPTREATYARRRFH